jgi:hypothetical protein
MCQRKLVHLAPRDCAGASTPLKDYISGRAWPPIFSNPLGLSGASSVTRRYSWSALCVSPNWKYGLAYCACISNKGVVQVVETPP